MILLYDIIHYEHSIISLLIILLQVWSMARKYVFNPPKIRFRPDSPKVFFLPIAETFSFRRSTQSKSSSIQPSRRIGRRWASPLEPVLGVASESHRNLPPNSLVAAPYRGCEERCRG
jgi:hypothetical protein